MTTMKWTKFFALLLSLSLLAGTWSVLQAQKKEAPFTLDEVLKGLHTQGVMAEIRTLAARNQYIARRVRERGVTFPLTEAFESELRKAGASPELLKAIREHSPALHKPVPTPTPKWPRIPIPDVERLDDEHPKALPPETVSFETVRLNDRGSVVTRDQKQARYYIEELGNGVTLEMVEVPDGTFLMGSYDSEVQTAFAEAKRYSNSVQLDWYTRETPRHRVTVPTFSMGRFEVTQAQWRAVMGGDPSYFKGDNLPVESVSWNDAVEFCARLKQKTGKAYRLPNEAEWEYAARAGTTTPFAFGETISPYIVNYDGNHPYASTPKGKYRQKTVPVGSLRTANAFGLFDLHGNVWELCEDVWHDNYTGAPNDGSAWTSGGNQSLRVLRGGSWSNDGWLCRVAYRYAYMSSTRDDCVGFRVVFSVRTRP